MALLRNEQMQLWRSRMNYLRRHDGQLKHPQRGSPVMSCHVWYIPFLISVWLTTMSFLLVTAVWLYDFNHTGLVFWHYGAVVCMLLPIRKLYGVAQDACFDHTQSHHHTFHNCSLCSHHGIEKGLVISHADHPVFDAAVDMSMSTLFLLKETAKCARYFLIAILLILLSGDVELNPGPVLGVNLKHLMDELTIVRHKAKEIGVQLGVPAEKIHEFMMNKEPLTNIIDYWLNGNVAEGPPCTWQSIVNALESNIVGEFELASLISEKYLQGREVPSVRDVYKVLARSTVMWSIIAIQLGLSSQEMKTFQENNDPLLQVIKYWLSGRIPEAPISWIYLLEVLKRLGEPEIAMVIREKYIMGEKAVATRTATSHNPLQKGLIDDEYKSLCSRLTELSGSVERLIANLVFVGLPCSGKTILIANLLKDLEQVEKLLIFSPSTDVLGENIAVGSTSSDSSVEWSKTNLDITDLIKILKNSAPGQEKVTSKMTVSDNEQNPSEEKKVPEQSIQSKRSVSNSDFNVESEGNVLVNHFFTKEQFEELVPHLKDRLSLNICDTGGQLELQELLPLFFSGPLLFIFVFPLHRKGLDYCPDGSYRCENDVMRPIYEVSMTVKDLLCQTLSSVKSLSLSKSYKTKERCIPHILLVGTHKDLLIKELIVFKKLKEIIKEFDESRLKEISDVKEEGFEFDSMITVSGEEIHQEISDYTKKLEKEIDPITDRFADIVILAEGSNNFFQVDNTEQCKKNKESYNFVADYDGKYYLFEVKQSVENKPTDKDVFSKIRSEVTKYIEGNEDQFKILEYPINCVLASLLLSKTEHFVEVDKFENDLRSKGIEISDKKGLKDIFTYLHLVTGQIRYYPEVDGMSDVIINQPEVLYRLMTHLIICADGLDKKQLQQFKAGIFTKKHFEIVVKKKLKDIKIEDKLFSPDKLLGILEELRIVIPYKKKSNELKLFMPCKLNQAEKFEGSQSSTNHPLAIVFDCDHCPKGLFGCLICFVMGDVKEDIFTLQERWDLKEKNVFSNHVSFTINKEKDCVTLTFFPTHFLVQFFQNKADAMKINDMQEICIQARKKLNSALIKARDHLHYDEKHWFICLDDCCKDNFSLPESDERRERNSLFLFCCQDATVNNEIWLGEKPAYKILPGDKYKFFERSNKIIVDEGTELAIKFKCDSDLTLTKEHTITIDDKSFEDYEIKDDTIDVGKVEHSKHNGEFVISSENAEGKGQKTFNLVVKKQPKDADMTTTTKKLKKRGLGCGIDCTASDPFSNKKKPAVNIENFYEVDDLEPVKVVERCLSSKKRRIAFGVDGSLSEFLTTVVGVTASAGIKYDSEKFTETSDEREVVKSRCCSLKNPCVSSEEPVTLFEQDLCSWLLEKKEWKNEGPDSDSKFVNRKVDDITVEDVREYIDKEKVTHYISKLHLGAAKVWTKKNEATTKEKELHGGFGPDKAAKLEGEAQNKTEDKDEQSRSVESGDLDKLLRKDTSDERVINHDAHFVYELLREQKLKDILKDAIDLYQQRGAFYIKCISDSGGYYLQVDRNCMLKTVLPKTDSSSESFDIVPNDNDKKNLTFTIKCGYNFLQRPDKEDNFFMGREPNNAAKFYLQHTNPSCGVTVGDFKDCDAFYSLLTDINFFKHYLHRSDSGKIIVSRNISCTTFKLEKR